jgi:hypothetical protein
MPLLARAAKLFTCYKARCQDDRGVWRLYFGLTRVDAAQTAEGAVQRREEWCRALPVAHFRTAKWDTLEYTPLGHLMTLDNALAEEALLTAEAMKTMTDYNVRGGPWHGAKLGYRGNEECRQVARYAYRWRAGLSHRFPRSTPGETRARFANRMEKVVGYMNSKEFTARDGGGLMALSQSLRDRFSRMKELKGERLRT